MITAVDTNVLLDVLIPGAPDAGTSELLLGNASAEGILVISEAVYAELVTYFPGAAEFEGFRADVGLRLLGSTVRTLAEAGEAWRSYASGRSSDIECSRCGRRQAVECDRCGARLRFRQHMLPDFLIGAHALIQADRLLTRDRGFYSRYFPRLTLVQ